MFEKIKTFFKEVRIELKKVVFPTKDEVIGSTRVVIVATVLVAAILGVVDLVLTRLVGFVIR